MQIFWDGGSSFGVMLGLGRREKISDASYPHIQTSPFLFVELCSNNFFFIWPAIYPLRRSIAKQNQIQSLSLSPLLLSLSFCRASSLQGVWPRRAGISPSPPCPEARAAPKHGREGPPLVGGEEGRRSSRWGWAQPTRINQGRLQDLGRRCVRPEVGDARCRQRRASLATRPPRRRAPQRRELPDGEHPARAPLRRALLARHLSLFARVYGILQAYVAYVSNIFK